MSVWLSVMSVIVAILTYIGAMTGESLEVTVSGGFLALAIGLGGIVKDLGES